MIELGKYAGTVLGAWGITLASASLTGLPANHKLFDLPLPGFLHTACPHHYRFAEGGESERALPPCTLVRHDTESMVSRKHSKRF